ncbi:MAG: NADH:flavin oxidoreductase/NADH oxidase [Salinigranum sp.]
MSHLFSPLTLRGTRIPNRIVVSPMCQYSAPDGVVGDWHLVHLGSRAVGGAGVVTVEATGVEPRGRITPYDVGLWNDEQADALARVARFVREQGSVPAIQLAHAGRKASTDRTWKGGGPVSLEEGGWEAVAPSADPWPHEEGPVPTRELSTGEIGDVVDAFADSAARAREAGFEILEVHAAHGYLIHEFLSPVTNAREDEYGGSFENRTRLIREVTAAIRAEWPDDRPLFVRISATDWLDDRDSWDLAQSVRLAPLVADAGADLIDVSAGGITPDSHPEQAGPGYQVPFAETIRRETDVPVATVGGLTDPKHADAVIRNGRADLAVLGRQHLRDPYFALHAAEELGVDVDWPVQYHRAEP